MNNSAKNVHVDLQVAQLLCSRLCHDLAGPAGAVHNGMELLEDSVGDDGALALIGASVGQMNGRLGFYRQAFGLGGFNGRQPALAEACDLTETFLKAGRTTLEWPDFPDLTNDPRIDQKRLSGAAKLLLNMVIIGADSLPRGGTLRIECGLTDDEVPGIGLAVMAGGRGAFIKDERRAAFDFEEQDDTTLSAHNVQVYFTRRLAEKLGGEIELTSDTDEVRIAVLLQE